MHIPDSVPARDPNIKIRAIAVITFGIIGAIVGTFLFPVIGTATGTILGISVASHSFAAPKFPKRK